MKKESLYSALLGAASRCKHMVEFEGSRKMDLNNGTDYNRLCCPACGNNNLHTKKVETDLVGPQAVLQKHYQEGSPVTRIYYSCDSCAAISFLETVDHKGCVYIGMGFGGIDFHFETDKG